jgi:hypothetical protein
MRRPQARRRTGRQRHRSQLEAHPDGTLVKALARAWRWQKLLDGGVQTSVTEIAEAEGIGKSIRAAAHGRAARGRERDIAASPGRYPKPGGQSALGAALALSGLFV